MGWINRIFGHNQPPTPPPASKPPVQQQPPASAPPAPPQDSVNIGQGSAPASQPPAAGAPAPAASTSKPNGSTPAGLPGSPANSAPTNITIDPTTGKPTTTEEQEARLRQRLHVIESVGRGLSGDYKMDLEAGDSWAYDFGSNTIIYKKDDLKGKSEDYAIGVILQETGRRVYSRPPQDPAFKDNPALEFLDNAVEGPRVCNLQTSKYAGAKEFFKTVYDQDILNKTEDDIRADLEASLVKNAGLTPEDARKAVMKMKSPVPRHMQYALGLIYDWYTDGKGKAPDWLRDQNAIRALNATKNDYHDAYKLPREIFDKDLTPKEIIDNAKKSEDIVVNKLWPVYKKLLEMDQKDLGMSMFGNQGGKNGKQSNKSGQNGQSGQSGQSGKNGKPQQGKQGQQGQQAGQGGQASGQQQQQGQQQQSQGGSGSSGQQQQGQQQQSQQSQGGGSGKAGQQQQNQQNQQSQGGGKADPNQKQQGQGGGQAGDKQDKQDPSQSDPSQAQQQQDKQQQGAGQSGKSQGQGQGQGAESKPETGDAGVPDPKDIDTTDNGQLDDSNLTDEQKDKARKAMEDLDKQYDRQVKSREQRDREDKSSNEGSQSTGQSGSSQGGGSGRQTSQIDLPTLQQLLKQKAATEEQVENLKTPYEKYYSMLAPLTDEMAGELKNVLQANDDMKYIGDFNSGNKLNLRRAMQAAAKYERTGQYDEDIWLRRSDPSKRDYDFVFVLDESGSMMDDQKWDNALKGLIMSAEALEELKVHFSVVGFSDQPAIHKSFDDKYDTSFREQMLAQIQRANHGGTNDSDALETALNMLREQSSDHQKVVVLITDGQGKEAELRQTIAEADHMGVKVIGVGIGDGMSYVKQVYPEHVVVNQIKDLPYELSDLIRDQILEGVNQGGR